MSRIAAAGVNSRAPRAHRQFVPLASTVAAALVDLLPVVVTSPVIPDFAFLVLVSWRLLRPELWSARTALGLGLINDLVAGHPLGQSMALWALTFLIFDLLETRLVWRDYWMDWLFATIAIIFYTFGGWYVALLMDSQTPFAVMLPQIGLSILVYPWVARLVLALDRWRLSR